MFKDLTVAAWFAISLFFITSSATADPYKWCAAYGTPGGTNCGSSRSNNAAQRSAEMVVPASQTSFTPGLKLHAPAANEDTIRAKLGGKMDGAS
jgi:hypothetical protein